MGGTQDVFYRNATRHFRQRYPAATLVADRRTLDGVLAYLAATPDQPIGSIYLVAHANQDGNLGFSLDDADLAQDRQRDDRKPRLTFAELRDNASRLTDSHDLGHRIDGQTWIHIKGCNVGRSQTMLELVDQSFTGAGRVSAPTHRQAYRSGRGGTVEYHDTYVLEYPGSPRMGRAAVVEAFSAKYPDLPAGRGRRYRTNRRVETPYQYRFAAPASPGQLRRRLPQSDRQHGVVRPRKATRDEGDLVVIEWRWTDRNGRERWRTWSRPSDEVLLERGRQDFARPDAWEWRVQADRRNPELVVVQATMTEYRIGGAIVDGGGQPLQPPVTDGTFHGTTN